MSGSGERIGLLQQWSESLLAWGRFSLRLDVLTAFSRGDAACEAEPERCDGGAKRK